MARISPRWRITVPLIAAGTVLIGGSALASVPRSIQGTFTHTFHTQDFANSDPEPTGTYTMKISPSAVIWTARGLGVSTEQAKTSGTLLLVRDKPGSVGRLCAQNGWGSYRYVVRGKTITFVLHKDPCKQRGEILGKTWARNR
jgi:hypothetical protein